MALHGTDTLILRRGARISDEEFRDLSQFIYSLLGIAIPEKRRHLLENRLSSRLDALSLSSFGDYLAYLRYAPEKNDEIDELVEKVTTNETFFFRDQTQLEGCCDFILRPLLERREKKGDRTLSIWSAGCSSGEEPYTLAILLADVLRERIKDWRITILGTDIAASVLAHAVRGVYGRHALRQVPQRLVARFFVGDGPRYQVSPQIRSMVHFERVNLNDRKRMRLIPPSDIIFCRNVIIYFDDEMKKRLMAVFYDNLVPGGSLLLGHSETLRGITRAFTPLPNMGSPVYRKIVDRSATA